MLTPLNVSAPALARQHQYNLVTERIVALIVGETDPIAILSTVCCELHAAFSYYHWTGFYRVTEPEILKVGPYQGGHGCLTIPFHRGICGMAARSRQTQRVADVAQVAGHIACSTTTRSEIVVPVVTSSGDLLAVLDVDSDEPSAFEEVDQMALESIARLVAGAYRRN